MKLSFLNFFGKKKSAVGIEVSDRSIKVLSLKKDEDKLFAEAFGYASIEEGVVENGQIIDAGKLAIVLGEIFEKAQPTPIKPKSALIAIPESRTFINNFKVEAEMTGKDLEEKIRMLAGESIPFEPQALYFDFKEIAINEKTNKKEILYVASPKEIVDKYLWSLNKVGIETVIFDIESASLARALLGGGEMQSNVLILDMGARTTNMSIIDRGQIYSSISFPFGGNHLTKAISTNFKLSFEEADRMKMALGMDEKSGDNKISPILNSFCMPVINDIKQDILHYQEKTGRKIGTIVICGGSSLMTGIDAYLEEKIGLKITRINPWIKWQIEISSEGGKIYFKKEAPILYATVIGLALRGLEKNPQSIGINLINFEGRSIAP